MSAWTCRSFDGKAAPKIAPPRPRIHGGRALVPIPKRSASPRPDVDAAAVVSLKVLDPNRPIREEADIDQVSVTIRNFLSAR
jgi:hypothetical protein